MGVRDVIQPWVTFLVAIVYVSILFLVASYGDKKMAYNNQRRSKPNIYAFSLAIYCTTWTFFGSVGLASTSGINFLAIYLGPVFVITLGYPLMLRVIRLSKEERITSVADFLGSRYGKNIKVAAVAAIIAVIGTIPYIALQLKAISGSVDTLLFEFNGGFPSSNSPSRDISFFVAITLVAFAILFGTRHADATENQHGLMLAIATESVIKLLAFVSIGIFVTWFMFDGVGDLFSRAAKNEQIQEIYSNGVDFGQMFILTLLSITVFLLLPRQFHVAVVENNSESELKRARWLFPLYLVAINLFVIPIAMAGIIQFGKTGHADEYVLLLPMLAGQNALGLFGFIGGLSAGTAMVVMASVALAIMISNDLVLPLILRSQAKMAQATSENMERKILSIRRTAILVILMLAYAYYLAADNSAALASIGLISFAAIAQLGPAFFGGLFWKKANARGAILGMVTGFCVWAYSLLLPTLLSADSSFVLNGPFGIALLKPQALLGLELSPLANGVLWSLALNTLAFIIGSHTRQSDTQEQIQANLFTSYQTAKHSPTDIGAVSGLDVATLKNTLSKYLGETRTKRSFENYCESRNIELSNSDGVDNELLRFSEQILASAIGASSSRLVHGLLLKRFDISLDTNIELLDEASKAVQFNHDVLHAAIDQLEQGITVFDGNYQLASWNKQFRELLNLPAEIGQAGTPLSDIAQKIISQNKLEVNGFNEERLSYNLLKKTKPWQLQIPNDEMLEIKTSAMPEGGIVITWHNITQRVRAAQALRNANETLEGRVISRTHELEHARQVADQANVSKTRFLAAAGHDILQPLNAARLYSSTLVERVEGFDTINLVTNVNRSLDSVEEILSSLLAISRLDSSQPKISFSNFPIRTITEQLELEFGPIANRDGLDLCFVHSSKWIHSDRAMLKRLLQNLISNALKFTKEGKVLVGVRILGDKISIEVLDTGIGMSNQDQARVFEEFTRLKQMKEHAPGLGLGLSIVERIAKLLNLKVDLHSIKDKGSHFKLAVDSVEPVANTVELPKQVAKINSNQLGGMNILCIDNDVSILDGMRVLLGEWGCNVATATDLDSATKAIEDFMPQMILVDYHLENISGIEVYNTIHENLNDKIPGVLITADRTEEVKLLAKETRISLLNKPVKPAALRSLLTQNSQTRSAAE